MFAGNMMRIIVISTVLISIFGKFKMFESTPEVVSEKLSAKERVLFEYF